MNTVEDLLKRRTDVAQIDLDSPASPAVLSGLFSCNVQGIYQYRQDGKLPANSDASYRDCIKHYITYWKTKSVRKASNISEAAILQKTQLDRVKTEREWLNLRKERGELLDVKELALVFEPYFIQVRGRLVSITRKFPETTQEINEVLMEWESLGKEMCLSSDTLLSNYIQEEMEKEVDYSEVEEENSNE